MLMMMQVYWQVEDGDACPAIPCTAQGVHTHGSVSRRFKKIRCRINLFPSLEVFISALGSQFRLLLSVVTPHGSMEEDEVLDLNHNDEEEVPHCCAELHRKLEGERKRYEVLSREFQVCPHYILHSSQLPYLLLSFTLSHKIWFSTSSC